MENNLLIDEDGKRLIAFVGSGIECVVPRRVETIGDSAFLECKNLTKIVFEPGSSLRIIGYHAFDSAGIAAITIPSTVTEIKSNSFYQCTILASVAFEEDSHLESIGLNGFEFTGLRSITFPKSVRSIKSDAFFSTPLSSVTFEEGSVLERIGSWVFSNTQLTTITFPPTIRSFGIDVFDGAPITHIEVPGTAEFNDEFLGGVEAACTVCFYNCKEAPSIYVPANITVETREDNPIVESKPQNGSAQHKS